MIFFLKKSLKIYFLLRINKEYPGLPYSHLDQTPLNGTQTPEKNLAISRKKLNNLDSTKTKEALACYSLHPKL
jgi:hypothetical protein